MTNEEKLEFDRVVRERDDARDRANWLAQECDRTKDLVEVLRAQALRLTQECSALRAALDEARGVPFRFCSDEGEERGAKWALEAVRRGDVDAFQDVSKVAEVVCVEARKGGGR